VSGAAQDYKTAWPCGGVVIRDNLLLDSARGVILVGAVHRAQIVGNRIVGAGGIALQLENLLPGAEHILVANNTAADVGAFALRIWDDAFKGKDVQVRNNLFLGVPSQPDVAFLDSGGDPQNARAGRGELVQKSSWRMDHNWRQTRKPEAKNPNARAWVPPGPKDVVKDRIDLLSLKRDDPDFLRPDAKSGLATGGAGQEDPSLPAYVGAVPPRGEGRWDWDRTWQAWPPGALLTVSRQSADGGTYRSVQEALAAAKPWTTIRVLDSAAYPEPLALDNPERHQGIVLETRTHAQLVLPADAVRVLMLKNVPHVRVRGFQLREGKERKGAHFITATGNCPGLVLEDLDLRADLILSAILLQNVRAPVEQPLVVRGCFISGAGSGIIVRGSPGLQSQGIALRDNRVYKAAGVQILGAVSDTHVTGNLFWQCKHTGLHLEDLAARSRGLLIANNTCFDCVVGLRIWDQAPFVEHTPGQVEVRGNLVFGSIGWDMGWMRDAGGRAIPEGGDGAALLTLWRFGQNHRDLSDQSTGLLPLAPADRLLEAVPLVSRNPAEPDFGSPAPDSVLAREGAGKEDPAFPLYVGALPPRGAEPWDWDRTWRARMRPLPEAPPKAD
jgi:hypothetical protein